MSRQNCYIVFLALAFFFAGTARAADEFLLRGFVERALSESVSQVVNRQAISRLYTGRQYQPLWFGNGPLSAQRETLLKEIEASRHHGFDPSNYHYRALRPGDLPEEIQDVLLSDALLSQIQHRVSGVVDRKSIESSQDHWLIEPYSQTPAGHIDAILAKPAALGETLRTLWPEHPDYWRLLEKRATLAMQKVESQQPLVLGKLLKPGMFGEDVVALKTRLWGNAEVHSNQFDSQLESAIKVLQLEAGLESDGVVGEATLAILNASPQSRVEQIDANLERWRWLPRKVPEEHIRVNIASYRLRVFEKQAPVLSMDVIVGRPYRQTPVFTETIKYLVFNPFWNVPPSIANKDKLPLLKSDPNALAKLGYEVKMADNANFVSVGEVNWQGMRAGQFNLRQRPGEKNALGKVKFMLPNPHSIYLHDTPDKQLFAKTERLFSSGCIRLADPKALSAWILGRENNPQAAQLDSLFLSSSTTTVYLTKPVPVYLVYFTVFTDDDGRVVFRRDGYNRDQAIIDALHGNSTKHKGAEPS